MRWFRLYEEILDDPKMSELTDFQFRCLINLMSMASQCEVRGKLTQSQEQIAWRLRVKKNLLGNVIQKLVQLNILSNGDGCLSFINWNKRQFDSDDVTARVKRYRKRFSNVTVTAPDTDTDTDTEREEVKEETFSKPVEAKNSSPPCPHQKIVAAYNDTLGHLILPVKESCWKGSRASHLQARWRENESHQNLEFWQHLFEFIRDQCPFIIGKIPGRDGKPFRATLEWIVRENNFLNIIEGKYDVRYHKRSP